jgi:hypothetical protein
LYASRFEDLPIVTRVGDIIRVHRAALRIYDSHKQFNVNCQFNGSWALFQTDKNNNEPASYNGRNASFEKSEVAILSALRSWANKYFAANDGVTKDMYVSLKQAKAQKSDFDVVARITMCRDFDEYTNELRLTDLSGDSWFTLATKLKFSGVRDGQVVRIRSVTHDSSSTKQVLAQSHFSNIMSFLPNSKLAQAITKGTKDIKQKSGEGCANMVTQVGSKFSGMATTSLRDLFHSNASGKTFRVCLQVLAVQPGNVADMTKKSKGGFAWNAQLLCKDVSTANGDQ